jgi:hypothetical protein
LSLYTPLVYIFNILISNSCAKGGISIRYKNANLGVIRPKANASLYIIDFKALYAKALKLDLQAFVYK